MTAHRLIFACGLLLFGVFAPGMAAASLFCVEVEGQFPQCIYDDAAQCRQRASQLGGICDLNPVEMKLSPGYGQFCLVTSQRVSQCVYPDRNTCETEAARDHSSICIDNSLTGVQAGPYRYIPRRAY